MFEKFLFRSLAAVAVAALLATSAGADTITHGGTTIGMEFVTVGNPHNPDDTHEAGYGSVGYTYRIGTYEVNENQWDAVVAADTEDLLDDPGYWSGFQPVAHISWHEAAMFCNWLTSGDVTQGAYTINGSGEVTAVDRETAVTTHGTVYVIPTEDEWYKAAYYDPGKSGGAGYWDYPTKHDDPSVPDGIDDSGDTDPGDFDAVFYDGYDQGQPNNDDNAGVLSAYGTMGQGGNVWEWNETLIGSSRGVRGGDWYDSSGYLLASTRDYYYPTYGNFSLGFRVASIPEPGSITLLVCGTVAGLMWWRRRK